MKRLGIMAAVVIASSALFFGCDNGNGDDGDTTVKVTGVTITGTGVANGAASVAVDATLTLIATVEPANATNKTVTWKSSDTTKATVSETGVVTGVAAGEATITATAGGGGSTATVTITVTEPAKVESVTIKQNGIEVTEPIALPANDTVTLTAEVSPSNTNDADKAITWSTSDSAVATVTDGVVTWKGEGEATITATAAGKNASGQEVSASVTVQAASAPEAPKLVVFNQSASPADGTTTTLPQLTANGRLVFTNANTTALNTNVNPVTPDSVKDNLFVYLNNPIEGDFSISARVKLSLTSLTNADGAWKGLYFGAFNRIAASYDGSNEFAYVAVRYNNDSGHPRMVATRDANTASSNDGGWTVAGSKLYPKGVSTYEYIFVVSREGTTYTLEAKNSETGEVLASGTRTATGSQASSSLDGAVYAGFMLLDGTVELSNCIITQGETVLYKQNETDPGFTPITPTSVELSVEGAIAGSGVDYLAPIASIPEEGIDIIAMITPADATGGFEWSLIGTGAAVDQTGHMTITDVGTFTVTITSKTTSLVTDSFSFNIIADYDPVTSVTISGPSEVNVASSIPLIAEVLPLTADSEVFWSSSDPSIATVDPETGVVKGIAPGTVTITAVSYNGISGEVESQPYAIAVKAVSSVQLWNFSDEAFKNVLPTENGSIENNPYTIEGVTIFPGGSEMRYNTNSKTFKDDEDDLTFTHRLQLNGTGDKTKRVVKFDVTGDCTIYVYLLTGSTGNDRQLKVVNDADFDGTIQTTTEGSNVVKGSVIYTGEAGTIYLYSGNSGINLYGIKVVY